MDRHARWVIPADVVVASADEFEPELRAQLLAGADDRIVGRPQSRGRSVIVDAAGMALVRQFRKPTAIAGAILRYCREAGARWQNEVGTALELLECLRQARLLVPYRRQRDLNRPMLAPGTTVGRFTIGQCVHEFGEVQVYRASRNDARFALKILDRRPPPRSVQMLQREALVLQHLRGRHAPFLIEAGVHRGRPYLVQSWCEGVTALAAGPALRSPAGLRSSTDLHRLCLAILRAYQALHRLGALHGDVHAKNLIVKLDGGVHLVDFGLASWPAVLSSLPDPPGDAHPRYFSPEAAVAMLRGRSPTAATALSEQYALAALCFHLLTGGHHLAFGLRKTDWLREIAAAPPLPFSAHGEESWPEVESVLRRAFAKQPGDRFPSVGALADAFETACTREVRSVDHGGASSRSTAQHHLDATIQRLRFDGGLLPAGFSVAPTCSVNYGAAGVAYFFYRLACLRESAELLHSANAWALWAERHLTDVDASHCDAIHITRKATGPISLYHMASGVHYVQALISVVLGDGAGIRRHVDAFVAAGRTACENLDVTLGRGGILLGCTNLLGALPKAQWAARERVARLGRTIARAILRGITGGRGGRPRIASLGIAHGRAGITYALLRWHEVSPLALAALERSLDDLALRATIDKRGASWPMRIGQRPGSRSRWVSWCNGSAGQVYLWTLAHRIFGHDRYADLASQSASYVWNVAQDRNRDAASLCCGYAGQAYALLNLHRATGDGVWHDRARHLSERAAFTGCASHRDSLFKGDVGVALLAEEVQRPETARMPVFEDEGWARREH